MNKYLILLLFFQSVPVPAADGLGRLFLTPEQRAQLDLVRVKRDPGKTTASDADPAPTPIQTGSGVVTYNGAVRRSDGKSTIWINNKPLNDRDRTSTEGGVNVLGIRRDGAVSVAIPQANRSASLKVGQSLDVNTGRIDEPYYARQVARSKPAENSAPASPSPGTAQVNPPVAEERATKK